MKSTLQYPKDFIFYPDNFGVKATDEQINKMIQDCIDYLENFKEQTYMWERIGRTKVYVFRYHYKQNINEYYYEIEITHNFSQNNTIDR